MDRQGVLWFICDECGGDVSADEVLIFTIRTKDGDVSDQHWCPECYKWYQAFEEALEWDNAKEEFFDRKREEGNHGRF